MRWLPLVFVVACSGDDSHRHVAAPRDVAQTTPADAGVDAPPGTAFLSEDMAAPYWKSPDELAGAQQIALHAWQPARDAFARALAATKDPARAARIELMIGLASEELADWP